MRFRDLFVRHDDLYCDKQRDAMATQTAISNVGAPPAPQICDDVSLDLVESSRPIMFLLRWRPVTVVNQPTQRADDDWVCHANVVSLARVLKDGATGHDFHTDQYYPMAERFYFSNIPAKANAIVECWEASAKPLKPCWKAHNSTAPDIVPAFHWHKDAEHTKHAFYYAANDILSNSATLLGRIPMKT